MRQGKRSYQSAGKLSRTVLYALLSLTAVVFLLFFAVGFQMPYVDNPRFNAPLLTDVLLIFVALLAGCSLAAVVWAVVVAVRRRGRKPRTENGINVTKLSVAVSALTIVLAVLSFAFGSAKPIIINASRYDTVFWLKAADMFVVSSLVLLLLAVALIVAGYVRQALLSRK